MPAFFLFLCIEYTGFHGKTFPNKKNIYCYDEKVKQILGQSVERIGSAGRQVWAFKEVGLSRTGRQIQNEISRKRRRENINIIVSSLGMGTGNARITKKQI